MGDDAQPPRQRQQASCRSGSGEAMRTQGAKAREEAGDEAPQDSRRRSIPLRDGGQSDLPSQTLPACRVQSQKLRQPTSRTWPTKETSSGLWFGAGSSHSAVTDIVHPLQRFAGSSGHLSQAGTLIKGKGGDCSLPPLRQPWFSVCTSLRNAGPLRGPGRDPITLPPTRCRTTCQGDAGVF